MKIHKLYEGMKYAKCQDGSKRLVKGSNRDSARRVYECEVEGFGNLSIYIDDSRFHVIDVDNPRILEEWKEKYPSEIWDKPNVCTPSGGYHFYIEPVKGIGSFNVSGEWDYKGTGGSIMIPPSRITHKGEYKLVNEGINITPEAFIRQVLINRKNKNNNKKSESQNTYTPDEVRDMLRYVDPGTLDYDTWFKIICSVFSHVPHEAEGLLVDWCKRDKAGWNGVDGKTPGRISLFETLECLKHNPPTNTTIGTLIHHARTGGWNKIHHNSEITIQDLEGTNLWDYGYCTGIEINQIEFDKNIKPFFFNKTNGEKMSREQFNDRFNREGKTAKGKPTHNTTPMDKIYLHNHNKRTYCNNYTWNPTNPETIYQEGHKQVFNTFQHNKIPKGKQAEGLELQAIEMLEWHLTNTFKLESSPRFLIKWMAFNCQNTGVKSEVMPHLTGIPRTGKTIVGDLLSRCFGEYSCEPLDSTTITSNFTGHWYGLLLGRLNELQTVVGINRYQMKERLKTPITDIHMSYHPKGMRAFKGTSYMNLIATSNSLDTFPHEEDEQRIVHCEVKYQNIKYQEEELQDVWHMSNKQFFSFIMKHVTGAGLRHYLENQPAISKEELYKEAMKINQQENRIERIDMETSMRTGVLEVEGMLDWIAEKINKEVTAFHLNCAQLYEREIGVRLPDSRRLIVGLNRLGYSCTRRQFDGTQMRFLYKDGCYPESIDEIITAEKIQQESLCGADEPNIIKVDFQQPEEVAVKKAVNDSHSEIVPKQKQKPETPSYAETVMLNYYKCLKTKPPFQQLYPYPINQVENYHQATMEIQSRRKPYPEPDNIEETNLFQKYPEKCNCERVKLLFSFKEWEVEYCTECGYLYSKWREDYQEPDISNCIIWDIESYPNYFCIGIQWANGKREVIELRNDSDIDIDERKRIVNRIIQNKNAGFNSLNYDIPMLWGFSRGESAERLNNMSNKVINWDGLETWKFMNEPQLKPFITNHIDIMSIHGREGLKTLAIRLGFQDVEDLPYSPDEILTTNKMDKVRDYNIKDINNTFELYKLSDKGIELREMLEEKGIPARNKTDSQIADSFARKHGTNGKPDNSVEKFAGLKYQMCDIQNAEVKEHFITLLKSEYETVKGKIKLKGGHDIYKQTTLTNNTITFKDGGIHTGQNNIIRESGNGFRMKNMDVASYYPALLCKMNLQPPFLLSGFSQKYKDLMKQRLTYKKAGKKVESDALKIILNSTFGKMGSEYSPLYYPQGRLSICIAGQMYLYRLCELMGRVEGLELLDANTDGILIYYPEECESKVVNIAKQWESDTSFELEYTDVNQYVAMNCLNYTLTEADGKIKQKGNFAEAGLRKGLNASGIYKVASESAIRGYKPELSDIIGLPHQELLYQRESSKGEIVSYGKHVRFYWSKTGDDLKININGKLSNLTNGKDSKAIMNLSQWDENDIDFERYLEASIKIYRRLTHKKE